VTNSQLKHTSEELLNIQAKNKDLTFAIREHVAKKAGKHLDLVIGSPTSEFTADFVIPKPRNLDELIGTKLAIEQEPHPTSEFLLDRIENEHIIEEGYGEGTWKTVLKGKAKQVGNKHSFELESEDYKFKMYRIEPTKWLIRRT
jgi:hypothetical protein